MDYNLLPKSHQSTYAIIKKLILGICSLLICYQGWVYFIDHNKETEHDSLPIGAQNNVQPDFNRWFENRDHVFAILQQLNQIKHPAFCLLGAKIKNDMLILRGESYSASILTQALRAHSSTASFAKITVNGIKQQPNKRVRFKITLHELKFAQNTQPFITDTNRISLPKTWVYEFTKAINEHKVEIKNIAEKAAVTLFDLEAQEWQIVLSGNASSLLHFFAYFYRTFPWLTINEMTFTIHQNKIDVMLHLLALTHYPSHYVPPLQKWTSGSISPFCLKEQFGIIQFGNLKTIIRA